MSSTVSATSVATAVSAPRWQRALALGQDALLVTISSLACYAHINNVLAGRWSSAAFAAEQAMLVGLFLMRRRTTTTSRRPLDWIVAAGGWLPLVMRPHESGLGGAVAAGMALQLCGLSFTLLAFLYLGRSFGVVAANRGVKIQGPYRLVRHPIYLSHTASLIGFAVANFTVINVALLLLTTIFQLLRIRAEERVLGESEQYQEYATRVRWRLVPGLF